MKKKKMLKILLMLVIALLMCNVVSYAQETVELNLGETREISIVDTFGMSLVWYSSNTNIVKCSNQTRESTSDPFKKKYTCDFTAQATGQATVTVVDEFTNTIIQTIHVQVSKYRAIQCADEIFQISVTSSVNQMYTISCTDGSDVYSNLSGVSSMIIGSYAKYTKTYNVSMAATGEHVLQIVGSNGNALSYEVMILNHNWGQESVENPATCTVSGTKIITCTRCKKTKRTEIPELGHEYSTSWTVDKEPTCKEEGEKTRHCIRCSAKIDAKPIATIAHNKGEWEIEIPASCIADGKKVKKCINCKEILQEEKINALGHGTGAWEVVRDATCKRDGKKVKKCINCKVVLQEEKINALGHDMGEWEIVIDATCKKDGKKIKKCTRCEWIETEDVPTIGHTEKWIITQNATCTEAGKKVKKCIACGKQIGKSKNITPIGHVMGAWHETDNSTKIKPKEIRTCSKCGKTEIRTMKLAATSLKLSKNQSTKKFSVTGLKKGDSVASIRSSQPSILKVQKFRADGTCVLKTAKKTGKAYLIITLKSGLERKIKVTVQNAKIETESIKFTTKNVTITKKSKYELKPILDPITTQDKIIFTSKDEKIATVNSKGVIIGKKKGKTTINVKCGKKKITIKVTVK